MLVCCGAGCDRSRDNSPATKPGRFTVMRAIARSSHVLVDIAQPALRACASPGEVDSSGWSGR
jgi:hypothetical protein